MSYLRGMQEYYAGANWGSLIAGTAAFVIVYCCLKLVTGYAIGYAVKNIIRSPGVNVNDEKLQHRIRSSFWSFVVYTLIMVHVFSYITQEEWALRPSQYAHFSEKPSAPIFFHYYIEFLHYIIASICLFLEPRGRDFSQMLAHHCLTLFLISLSYRSKLLRYGVVVMSIHDVSDPFLEMAKICRYLNLETASVIIFMFFSSTFFFLRIVFFPFFVIRSAINFTILSSDIRLTHCSLTGGLVLLLVINIVWMFQIVKLELDTITHHRVAQYDNVSEEKHK